MARIRLTILVHESCRDCFPEVVERCREAGLAVEREMVSIGVITGSIDEAGMHGLESIEGVAAVEPERTHRGFE